MFESEIQASVRLMAARERVVPNDKISKTVFNLNEQVYEMLTTGGKVLGVDELKNHPKFGTVTSYVKILSTDGANTPLNQFDRAVYNVLLSEKLAGNECTTFKVIQRSLTGKIGQAHLKLRDNQAAAIKRSVIKLMGTVISIDMEEACVKLKYNEGVPIKITGAIFPSQIIEVKIKGHVTDAILFNGESPLYEVANAKNQILHYDASLLNVPQQNNTPRIIAIKNYLMVRLQETLNHDLSPTITFKKLFEHFGLSDAPPKVKFEIRQAVIDLFEYLRQRGTITNFNLKANNGSYDSVSFNL